MPANPALPVLFTLLISLFPLSMYCLMLSSINRRSEPLLVRGAWDFCGVLFAGSGMILWAGPAMLGTLFERSISGESSRSFEALLTQWWLLWLAYYGLVVLGAILLLWLRKPTTAIYNVQPDLVPGVIAAVLQRLGYDFAQNTHHQFLIAPAKSLARSPAGPEDLGDASAPGFANDGPRPYSAAVEVDEYSSLCHATLHWYEVDARMRGEIETELQKHLGGARAVDNPAAAWQLAVGILLFGAIFLSLLFVVLAGFVPRR